MKKPLLKIIKIGGNVIDDTKLLHNFIKKIANNSTPFILIHGGGKIASETMSKQGITPNMINGRRITDTDTIDIVTSVYAGLINKKIVALLQAQSCNALGLSGADGNSIQSNIRPKEPIDFGWVGDPHYVNTKLIDNLLKINTFPVFCALTHDKQGNLLNTNADTIASTIAIAMADYYEIDLIYCFEKNGVLMDVEDNDSFIPQINPTMYQKLKSEKVIFEGMIPKLDNAFLAIEKGVEKVILCHPKFIDNTNIRTTLCK